jgi:hypothetical protein
LAGFIYLLDKAARRDSVRDHGSRQAFMSNLALRLPRQLSDIDELHGRVPAQRQALLATVLVAIEDRPPPSVLGSDPQRQARR